MIPIKGMPGIMKLEDAVFTFSSETGQNLLTLSAKDIKRFRFLSGRYGNGAYELIPRQDQEYRLIFSTYKGPKSEGISDEFSDRKWLDSFKAIGVDTPRLAPDWLSLTVVFIVVLLIGLLVFVNK